MSSQRQRQTPFSLKSLYLAYQILGVKTSMILSWCWKSLQLFKLWSYAKDLDQVALQPPTTNASQTLLPLCNATLLTISQNEGLLVWNLSRTLFWWFPNTILTTPNKLIECKHQALAKIPVTRLNRGIGVLIHCNQVRFMPTRQASDNIQKLAILVEASNHQQTPLCSYLLTLKKSLIRSLGPFYSLAHIFSSGYSVHTISQRPM